MNGRVFVDHAGGEKLLRLPAEPALQAIGEAAVVEVLPGGNPLLLAPILEAFGQADGAVLGHGGF